MIKFAEISKYIESHLSPEDPLLAELTRETQVKVLFPQMLSGHLQGKFLEFISRMLQPEYILEIGTFTGYSAICLAKGLKSEGKLITIEINDELAKFPEKYFKKAGLSAKIKLIIGDALKIIPSLDYQFDLVFIDAEKKDYPVYYHEVIDKLKPGGYILADNVLWYGRVINDPETYDKETQGIVTFNSMVNEDPRVENMIIPIRDGLMLIRKK
jgi:predicted O-methyltransferase YrrM